MRLIRTRTLEDVNTKAQWHDWAHIFINGTGILNTWKWPEIEGLHDFSGPLMHSAKWDHTVDFDNKTVGVIGTGSTSVQIVPQLQKICKEVQVFMRSPTWISPPFGSGNSAFLMIVLVSDQAFRSACAGANQRYKALADRVPLITTNSPQVPKSIQVNDNTHLPKRTRSVSERIQLIIFSSEKALKQKSTASLACISKVLISQIISAN
jgi:cation diffusion facilitator CzcD-associated flavoprotein CzcO